MKSLKMSLSIAAFAATCSLAAAVPEVSAVAMSQEQDRTVTISYTLSDPAVVTLDIVTNSVSGWVTIGATNVVKATGDVWKRVGSGAHSITWRPALDWNGNNVPLAAGGVKAVVTAWATDDTPDYMVVDVSGGVAQKTVSFYPSAEHLPGGILSNTSYRLTKIVMRRINAANIPWMMGSNYESGRAAATDAAHTVMLTNNFYIGVFELTQGQFIEVTGISGMSGYAGYADSTLRPLCSVAYNKMRCAPCTKDGGNTYSGGAWPNAPYEGSFLDLLRTRTGIAFDLPTEAEWEFACRSGTLEGQWNDGSAKTDANLPGEWNHGASSGYAPLPCGSYAPSKWGLYDMHGNIYELCHDWFQQDITTLGGVANVNPSNPLNTLNGTAGEKRVRRGGACHTASAACGASRRDVSYSPDAADNKWGYRLVCPVGIAE